MRKTWVICFVLFLLIGIQAIVGCARSVDTGFGSGSGTFSRVASLETSIGPIVSAAIDTTNGYAYFGARSTPAKLAKVNLSTFTVEAVASFGESNPYLGVIYAAVNSIVVDAQSGFLYFETCSSGSSTGGYIVKVRLSDLSQVATLESSSPCYDAVIDAENGFAYFPSYTLPGSVQKIRLSDFTRVGSVGTGVYNRGYFHSAAIDTTNGFAYFGTDTSGVGYIYKVRLSDFSMAGALTLEADEGGLRAAVIDTTNGFAYFGTSGSPAEIIKVDLGDFTRVSAISLEAGENKLGSAVIDTGNGFAYFGTRTSPDPGKVVKIRLSDFTRVEAITLTSSWETQLTSAVIDTANNFAYFGADTSGPHYIIKISTTH